MKSTLFYRLSVSILLIAGFAAHVHACEPYAPTIPTPEFFRLQTPHKIMSDYERDENLKLWRDLTAEDIPLSDIEDAVYKHSLDEFIDKTNRHSVKSNNLFYTYLRNVDDDEIVLFLEIAKNLEKRWRDMRSPWFYPEDRHSDGTTGDLSGIIEVCKAYDGVKLRDRYALQISRALFASGQYADCIEYSDSAFANIPDTNLMKRMAQRYVAGCWRRLGETCRADSVFAQSGDIWSISPDNRIKYMVQLNPNAPQLMEYIRSNASDTSFMRRMMPVARKLVNDNRVKCKGDWHFMMAYVNHEFNSKSTTARKQIYKALRLPFSSDNLKDFARAYRMKLDGQAGIRQSLLADLKWMENQTDVLNPDATDWIEICRNIIYVDWIPRLWKARDYCTAILLCSYAENLIPYEKWHRWCTYRPSGQSNENDAVRIDYGVLSFQMMGSLTSSQLISVYSRIFNNNPLYNFLRRKALTDRNYYYELTGTLALREENYARAEHYLSRVSENYLKEMNIYKEGYLSRDPFEPFKSRLETISTSHSHSEPYGTNAKLIFARKMRSYKQKMLHGKTADERGLARLMYAIGRRNSFEDCWALTQYWRGWAGIFDPSLYYWDDDFSKILLSDKKIELR